jgi:hypothetical protein
MAKKPYEVAGWLVYTPDINREFLGKFVTEYEARAAGKAWVQAKIDARVRKGRTLAERLAIRRHAEHDYSFSVGYQPKEN